VELKIYKMKGRKKLFENRQHMGLIVPLELIKNISIASGNLNISKSELVRRAVEEYIENLVTLG
jgi:predicted DNA-binding protein